jgi:nucleotide-binding universal stress UspA family protein
MSLTILTVADDMPPTLRPELDPTPYGTHGDPARYIHSLVTKWKSSIPTVSGLALRDPISVESGVRAHLLHQRPASLVAVTTRARSGMQRLRLGSVATNIINASLAPCLVIPVRE